MCHINLYIIYFLEVKSEYERKKERGGIPAGMQDHG